MYMLVLTIKNIHILVATFLLPNWTWESPSYWGIVLGAIPNVKANSIACFSKFCYSLVGQQFLKDQFVRNKVNSK